MLEFVAHFVSSYVMLYSPIYYFIWKSDGERETEKERDVPSAATLPQIPQQLGLGQVKTQSLEVHSGFPQQW